LKIYNALGALIFEKPVDVEAIEINTVEWNSGVYFIQVKNQMYKMIKH
jgi:hypothetical protein